MNKQWCLENLKERDVAKKFKEDLENNIGVENGNNKYSR